MGGCCSSVMNIGLDGLRTKEEEEEEVEEESLSDDEACKEEDGAAGVKLRRSCRFVSMHTRQGKKGTNQDAMAVWENFNGESGSLFCGVFDGHGPSGDKVAHLVKDLLPLKLARELQPSKPNHNKNDSSENGEDNNVGTIDDANMVDGENNHHPSFIASKIAFVSAYREMDKELKKRHASDYYCSGATAVSILKQGNDLLIANLGDSRAILCTKDSNNEPVPVQLTIDLKPNIPSEIERINRYQGRVFPLPEAPDVYRLWHPNNDYPGLAMARAFGDFCLKDYGLISVPQVSYRKLTDDDDFVVLATDGVWDVLSNEEVVNIVASTSKRSKAAKILVDHAVQAWKTKYPFSRIDDCAVVCLFLRNQSSSDKTK